MTRRPDPERIETAWREGTRARLLSSGMSAETADLWLAAWARQAAQDGVGSGAAYWDAGWDWIEGQCRLRARP